MRIALSGRSGSSGRAGRASALLGLLSCAQLLGAAASAQTDADAGPDWAAPGIYGAALGSLTFALSEKAIEKELDKTLRAQTPPRGAAGLDIDPTPGFSFKAGLRAHRHFGGEFQFDAFVGGYSGKFRNVRTFLAPPTFGDGVTYDLFVWTTNFKAYPLTGRWQPWVQAGAGIMSVDGETKGGVDVAGDVGFAARFGAGFDYHITESWAATLGADYVLPTGKVKDFDYITVNFGIQYTFRWGY